DFSQFTASFVRGNSNGGDITLTYDAEDWALNQAFANPNDFFRIEAELGKQWEISSALFSLNADGDRALTLSIDDALTTSPSTFGVNENLRLFARQDIRDTNANVLMHAGETLFSNYAEIVDTSWQAVVLPGDEPTDIGVEFRIVYDKAIASAAQTVAHDPMLGGMFVMDDAVPGTWDSTGYSIEAGGNASVFNVMVFTLTNDTLTAPEDNTEFQVTLNEAYSAGIKDAAMNTFLASGAVVYDDAANLERVEVRSVGGGAEIWLYFDDDFANDGVDMLDVAHRAFAISSSTHEWTIDAAEVTGGGKILQLFVHNEDGTDLIDTAAQSEGLQIRVTQDVRDEYAPRDYLDTGDAGGNVILSSGTTIHDERVDVRQYTYGGNTIAVTLDDFRIDLTGDTVFENASVVQSFLDNFEIVSNLQAANHSWELIDVTYHAIDGTEDALEFEIAFNGDLSSSVVIAGNEKLQLVVHDDGAFVDAAGRLIGQAGFKLFDDLNSIVTIATQTTQANILTLSFADKMGDAGDDLSSSLNALLLVSDGDPSNTYTVVTTTVGVDENVLELVLNLNGQPADFSTETPAFEVMLADNAGNALRDAANFAPHHAGTHPYLADQPIQPGDKIVDQIAAAFDGSTVTNNVITLTFDDAVALEGAFLSKDLFRVTSDAQASTDHAVFAAQVSEHARNVVFITLETAIDDGSPVRVAVREQQTLTDLFGNVVAEAGEFLFNHILPRLDLDGRSPYSTDGTGTNITLFFDDALVSRTHAADDFVVTSTMGQSYIIDDVTQDVMNDQHVLIIELASPIAANDHLIIATTESGQILAEDRDGNTMEAFSANVTLLDDTPQATGFSLLPINNGIEAIWTVTFDDEVFTLANLTLDATEFARRLTIELAEGKLDIIHAVFSPQYNEWTNELIFAVVSSDGETTIDPNTDGYQITAIEDFVDGFG
ncbi:MAG: hypothetical protein K0U36_04750, partial [Alphaproteobacteria bacterium]|nr:hypothetical protein [Alphaproteobacteria bacterium]